MKTQRLILSSTLCALVLLLVAAPAGAQTSVDECEALINIVQSDLDLINGSGGIGGNNPERTYESLASKLEGARTKLEQDKFADALQKLIDFRNEVISLRDAAKPKLSADDASRLIDGVNGAIDCVQSLL